MNKGASLIDRLISILSYITFGMFSIIWLIFANLTKKPLGPYLVFNIYQAIFISVILAVISLMYSIAVNLLSVIPFIGSFVKAFDLFFNATPLYFSCTLSGLFVTILLLYLTIMCVFGQKPYVPMVSEIVNINFGR